MSIGSLTFSGYDIVVLLVVLVSSIMAMGRGFGREMISIVALVIALAVSLYVWGRFRFAAQGFIQPDWLADGALGAGTFVFSYLLVVFLLSGVNRSLRGREIGPIDRILGGGFGALRGFVVAALATMILTAQYRDAQDAQKLRVYMEDNPGAIPVEVLPKSVIEQMNAPPPQLPAILKNSTLFPILDRIGAGIRALPFAHMKSMAERVKDGDLSGLAKDLKK